MATDPSSPHEIWETEALAGYCRRLRGNKAEDDLCRLKPLWDAIQPVDDNTQQIIDQIVGLEICNWNLEESILAVCRAIGSHQPTDLGIGHIESMTDDRWKMIWAYHAALRVWLIPHDRASGYRTLLGMCDPDGSVQQHVRAMLGEKTELKALCVERLCLFLEFSLRHSFEQSSASEAYAAATTVVDEVIRRHNADDSLLKTIALPLWQGDFCYPSQLEPCYRKYFTSLDILLSSMGSEDWQAAKLTKGVDTLERMDALETYLEPIEVWLRDDIQESPSSGIADRIFSSLGEKDKTKVFLASLLLSLLRS